MAKGYQFGTMCYADVQEVARVSCASANGLVSSGYQTCAGYRVDEHSVELQLHIKGETEHRYTQNIKVDFCEYPTFKDTYAPLLAAVIPLLVLIWIGRRVYEVFNTTAAS